MSKLTAVAWIIALFHSAAFGLWPPCGENSQVAVVPGRPTFSNSASTATCGHLEMDYGWTRQEFSARTSINTATLALRMGLSRRADLQWNYDLVNSLTTNAGSIYGTGDNWIAVRYRFLDQRKRLPALAVRYAVKAPTAPQKVGGSGYVDHQLLLAASLDIRRVHFDGNLVENFSGTATGFSRGSIGSLAESFPVHKQFGCVLESYGGRLADGRTFASQFAGATFTVSPRYVLDAGIDFGLTTSAPRKRFLAGFSYSLGRLRSVRKNIAAPAALR